MNALQPLRQELGFLLIGWMLMPEHLHRPVKPEPAGGTSKIMQELKKRTALPIAAALRENSQPAWGRKMLARLRLPPSVRDESRDRVWQRRLVTSPDRWAWSSFRFDYLNDSSILTIDRLAGLAAAHPPLPCRAELPLCARLPTKWKAAGN